MHDLHAICKKYLSLLKTSFEYTVDASDNFRSRPVTTRMSDLEVMALAVIGETTSIDSENLLFSKLRTDYAHLFPNLIDRTRFNRRRRGLQP
ncbi:IS982 family transposase, partial [Mesonia ostreae]